jgi:GNAT superfamily N-acetyltransferase
MAADEISVERLTEYSDEVAAELGAFTPYLYPERAATPVDKAQLEAIIVSPDRDMLLAVKAGRIVGKATVNLVVTESYSKVHLDNFATHEDVRGSGLGRALWEELVVWGRQRGASYLTLVTSSEAAIDFYTHRGAIESPDRYFKTAIEEPN